MHNLLIGHGIETLKPNCQQYILVFFASAAIPANSCLVDADCGADKQCDRTKVLTSYLCQSGLDTEVKRGTCVAKPAPVDTTIPPCTRCGLCLKNVRASVEIAALNTTAAPGELANNFYAACSSANYTLAACTSVATAIASSFKGNLARRAGALCLRMGECTSSLSTDSTCVLSSEATGAIVIDAVAAPVEAVSNVTVNTTSNATEVVNATAVVDANSTAVDNTTATNATAANVTTVPATPLVRGMLDACTVEGVSSGMRVAGTYKFGAGEGHALQPVSLTQALVSNPLAPCTSSHLQCTVLLQSLELHPLHLWCASTCIMSLGRMLLRLRTPHPPAA